MKTNGYPFPKLPPLVIFALTMGIAFTVYWLTASRDLTWANYGVDGGDLITAVTTNGIPHPTGYPLYILVGKLANLLPLHPVAFRFNLLSAIAIAIAAAFVALIAYQQSPHHALTVSLSFAFASLIWGQAIITEVYGLYLAFVAAFLWALLREKSSLLTGLLLGLTITSHLTGWLLLPLALFLTPRQQWQRFALGLIIGLIPLLLLPLMASETSPVVWGDLNTVNGWLWVISGQLYRGYFFDLTFQSWLQRLVEWAILLASQFTWAGIPLILVSLFVIKQNERKTMWALLCTAVFIIVIASLYFPDDAIVNTLPALLLLSILLTPALHRLGWVAYILPIVLLLLNFQANNLKDDYLIRKRAEDMLAHVPDQAIVETPGDPTIFTLWYIIYTEKQQSDIIPVDSNLFAFDWYRDRLQLLNPDLEGLEHDNLAEFQERNQTKRPYCFASLAQENPGRQTNYSLICSDEPNP
jgi:hypothetical protein